MVNVMELLEENRPFAESLIWDLQRRYYAEMGSAAWRLGEVPHYVTSNLRQANAYAEMIVALYKDHVRLVGMDAVARISILELGGGSGRMAFYMLQRLQVLCAWEGIALDAFRYVLTDFTQSNLDFWRIHPRFQKYFETGVLDIGLLDVTQPGPIALQISGELLGATASAAPLVVVANYLLDSIPQDLLFVHEDAIYPVAVSASLQGDAAAISPAEVLSALKLDYSIDTAAEKCYESAEINAVLEAYRGQVADAYVLFPAIAMRCLAQLRTFSQAGVLLLTADKGGHELGSVCFAHPPMLSTHGSFSINVNYHALHTYCGLGGGWHAFPAHPYYSINTGCMFFAADAPAYSFTQRAAEKYLDDIGPDTYFTLYKCVRTHLKTVEMRDILAALRLSFYDSHQLTIYSPRIAELLGNMRPGEIADLITVMHRCWENYFPLQEDLDLATTLGSICYAVDAYPWALFYFSQSTDIYGAYSGTFYNMAVCFHMLGDGAKAVAMLQKVVLYAPENEGAQALLAEYADVAV